MLTETKSSNRMKLSFSGSMDEFHTQGYIQVFQTLVEHKAPVIIDFLIGDELPPNIVEDTPSNGNSDNTSDPYEAAFAWLAASPAMPAMVHLHKSKHNGMKRFDVCKACKMEGSDISEILAEFRKAAKQAGLRVEDLVIDVDVGRGGRMMLAAGFQSWLVERSNKEASGAKKAVGRRRRSSSPVRAKNPGRKKSTKGRRKKRSTARA